MGRRRLTSRVLLQLQETWLISEYCDKGNLDRAVIAGRFHNKETKAPNLVRFIYMLAACEVACEGDVVCCNAHSLGAC